MRRSGGWRSRWWLLTLAAVLLVVLFVPVERYRPSCGGMWERTYFDGPMRDEYVGRLTEALTENGFFHVRIGNEVFVKLVYPIYFYESFLPARSPWRLSPVGSFHSLDHFAINVEWRLVHSIIAGYGPNNTRIVPPQPVLDLLARERGQIEADTTVNEETLTWRLDFLTRDDCEVARATMIRIEDMRPEELLHYVPKTQRPERCGWGSDRVWDWRCGDLIRGTVGEGRSNGEAGR